jgi:hypothetical protein
MSKQFYAAVWLGIQEFDTCIAKAYKIEDIIAHGNSVEEVKANLEKADLVDDLQIRRFAIIKVEHIETVNVSIEEEVEDARPNPN